MTKDQVFSIMKTDGLWYWQLFQSNGIEALKRGKVNDALFNEANGDNTINSLRQLDERLTFCGDGVFRVIASKNPKTTLADSFTFDFTIKNSNQPDQISGLGTLANMPQIGYVSMDQVQEKIDAALMKKEFEDLKQENKDLWNEVNKKQGFDLGSLLQPENLQMISGIVQMFKGGNVAAISPVAPLANVPEEPKDKKTILVEDIATDIFKSDLDLSEIDYIKKIVDMSIRKLKESKTDSQN